MATFGIWALLMGFSFFETPKGQFENEIGQQGNTFHWRRQSNVENLSKTGVSLNKIC